MSKQYNNEIWNNNLHGVKEIDNTVWLMVAEKDKSRRTQSVLYRSNGVELIRIESHLKFKENTYVKYIVAEDNDGVSYNSICKFFVLDRAMQYYKIILAEKIEENEMKRMKKEAEERLIEEFRERCRELSDEDLMNALTI